MKGKFKSTENNLVYIANGNTSNKIIMGKSFNLVQCTREDNLLFLVPIDRLNNVNFFEKLKN